MDLDYLKLKLKQQSCTICLQALCELKSVKLNKDILNQLRFLIGEVNTSILEGIMCGLCLKKIQEAQNFKIRHHMDFTSGIHTYAEKEENSFVKEVVICYICKKLIKHTSYFPLLNSVYLQSIISYLDPIQDREQLNNFYICYKCHIPLYNFHKTINLLLMYSVTKISDPSESRKIKTEKVDEIKFKLESSPKECSNMAKEEKEIFTKQEKDTVKKELDLKTRASVQLMIFEEAELPNEGMWEHGIEEYKKSENITEQHLNIDEKCHNPIGVIFEGMVKCDHSNVTSITCNFETSYKCSYKMHMDSHKCVNENQFLKCKKCNYQTVHKGNLKRHILSHIETSDELNDNKTDIFKCEECQFFTKYTDCMKKHMLHHKKVDEIHFLKCLHCKFRTKHKTNLKRHMLKHKVLDKNDFFRCDQCDFYTNYKRYLSKHMKIHKNPNDNVEDYNVDQNVD